MNEAELRAFLQKQDQELKDLLGRGESKMKVCEARLMALEQHVTAGGGSGFTGSSGSLGELVTQSEGYQSILKGGRSSGRIAVKSFSEKSQIVTGPWAAPPTYLPTVQTPPVRQLRVRDLLPAIAVSGNLIEWPSEDTFSGGGGYQLLEGDVKNESTGTYSLKQSAIATVATFLAVSKQVVDDSTAFRDYIDRRLIYKLSFFIENELLYGVGGPGKIFGLVPQSTAATFSPMNLLDGSAAAISQLASMDVTASALICNASDWWQMRAQKAVSSGVYLSGDPLSAQTPVLWGIPVVPTPTMTQGTFLVGDFQGFTALFDRAAATLEISREHSDFFVRNLVAVLCEERLQLAVFNSRALVSAVVHAGS
jgi:HK97 family phage major capsid protein